MSERRDVMLRSNRALGYLAIAGVALLALVIRAYRIDAESVWYDEAFTVYSSAATPGEMLRILVEDFNHPPLHSLLVHWWFGLFGVGVVQARALSAVFGTLAVIALYWLGALLFDRRTAVIGALLLAISQLSVMYSQEARSYSMLLFLYIVTTACFVKAFGSGNLRDLALFVVAAALLLNTHYYAAFGVAALFVYAFWFRKRSPIRSSWWVAALVLMALAYVPWMFSGVIQAALRNPRGAVDNEHFADIASPLRALAWFNNGKVVGPRNSTPLWAILVGGVLFTVPAMLAVSTGEFSTIALLLLLSLVPLIAVPLLGVFHIIFAVRHVSFAAAPYYLLVARGILAGPRSTQRLLIVAIVCFSAIALRAGYVVPYRDNYRDPINILARENRSGDCLIVGLKDSTPVELYWNAYYHGRALPTPVNLAAASSRSDCGRVWLLWDKAWWQDDARRYAAVREQMATAFRAGPSWSFSGMDVRLYLPLR